MPRDSQCRDIFCRGAGRTSKVFKGRWVCGRCYDERLLDARLVQMRKDVAVERADLAWRRETRLNRRGHQ